ncbi:Probable receptor-like protein kinase At1g11050 [Linum perenne]
MAISSFLLFFLFLLAADSTSAATPPPISPPPLCPFNLTYVRSIPWDTSLCENPTASRRSHCCQTLLSLFGIGIAQHLRSTSFFQLPSSQISTSCLSDFQAQLRSISIDDSLVPLCFNDSTEFVSKPSSCVGIITTSDWIDRVGRLTPLDAACRGDVSGLTRCSSCLDAGLKVNSQLTNLMPNSTAKCFYFTCLYAVAMVNELGPLDAKTAGCILALPLKNARNPSSSKNKSSKKLGMILGIVFGAIGGIILAGLIVVLYKKRKRYRREKGVDREPTSSSNQSDVRFAKMGLQWFRLQELERATNGFSSKNMVGKGTFGVVYRGTLEVEGGSSLVAVKELLEVESFGNEKEFANEVEIVSKIKHKNLLPLRGCCVDMKGCCVDMKGRRRFLVYDFMANGSVADHLSNVSRRARLSWEKRKNIILDVAKGLVYLHCGVKPAIYHRDIKSSNILLDSDLRAKVADFGLARQGREDGYSHITTRVAGTHGFLAPEYAMYGHLSNKSDVYSFGVLVLEIMTARKVIDTSLIDSSAVLITDWVWDLVKAGRVEEAFDEGMKDDEYQDYSDGEMMIRFVMVGILCAHVVAAHRPTITEALKMLEGNTEVPKTPDRPLLMSR